jgi:hypothetical protein
MARQKKFRQNYLHTFEQSNRQILHPLKKPAIRYDMHTYEGSIRELDIVEEEKDIGVIIDSNLTFEKHISAHVNKANQMV